MKLFMASGIVVIIAALSLGQALGPDGRRLPRGSKADPNRTEPSRTDPAPADNSPSPVRPHPAARPPGAPNPALSRFLDPLSVPPRKTQAPAIDLSGKWSGVYTINGHV